MTESNQLAAQGGANEPIGLDSPVRVGAMLFTLVDPHRGHEAAYNRWYERDHQFGGCMVGAGWFSHRRWVATASDKANRFPRSNTAVANPATAGSYLATYWVDAASLGPALAWSSQQVYELYGAGRGFEARTHAHTAIYLHQQDFYRDADPVPMELALIHPYRALVSVHVDRADGIRSADLDGWMSTVGAEMALDADSPIGSISTWRPIIPKGNGEGDAPMELGTGPGTHARTCLMCFVDGDTGPAMERIRTLTDELDASAIASVQLVAPFRPTVPGTDRYADQLWPAPEDEE